MGLRVHGANAAHSSKMGGNIFLLFVISFPMSGKKTCFPMLDCVLRGVVFTLLLASAPGLEAATIWNGPWITYSQPAPAPAQASNQDRMTPDVWLTRAASKGLFNAFYETNATALSPTNTEWALGTLTNQASLHYTNWLALLNGASPVTLVGQQLVVHLRSDDIYLSLQFTFWGAGGAGGFAYQRSTPTPASLSAASITNGQFSFSYTADPGMTSVVQSSTNLADWSSEATNTGTGGLIPFFDPLAQAGAKFYRVRQLPAP